MESDDKKQIVEIQEQFFKMDGKCDVRYLKRLKMRKEKKNLIRY